MTLAGRLGEALAEVAAALEAGDPQAAAGPSGRVAALCEEARAGGIRLSARDLSALLEAQARADTAARASQARLGRDLQAASVGLRAARAYRG